LANATLSQPGLSSAANFRGGIGKSLMLSASGFFCFARLHEGAPAMRFGRGNGRLDRFDQILLLAQVSERSLVKELGVFIFHV